MHALIDPRADPEYEKYLEFLPSDEYVVVPHVPLLDEHETTDPKTGKKIVVDEKKLQQLVNNCNRKMEETFDATPFVLGHTEDNAPESEQPEIIGYFVRYCVDRLLNTNRKAAHGDLFLQKSQIEKARKHPRRSVEYWVNRNDLDPVSALGATSPERQLGLLRLARTESDVAAPVIKFARGTDEELVYRYSISQPHFLPNTDSETMATPKKYAADNDMPDDKEKAEKDAVAAEGKSPKELNAKVDQLTEMVSQLTEQFSAFMEALMQGEGGEEGKDADPEAEKGADKGKDAKKGDDSKDKGDEADLLEPLDKQATDPNARKFHDNGPVKFGGAPGPYSSFVPTGDTKKMAADKTNDEVLKYKREFDSYKVKAETENRELKIKLQRLRAEKLMGDLETGDRIDFGDESARKDELELMANLSDPSLEKHVERIKLHYKRRNSSSESLTEVLKHSRRDSEGPAEPKDMGDEFQRVLATMTKNPGLSYEEALAKSK